MKNFKEQQKGITLVALVVTIVVLLILAGISINAVLGDNGLITKAKDAKDATRYATIKDEYDMYKYGKEISKITGTSSSEQFADFLDKLEDQGSITDEDRTQIEEEGKLTISEKYEIIFNESKTLVEAFNEGEIQVGDYLNYSDYVNAANTYTSVTNENGWANQTYSVDTATQWRVLGLSEDGTQLMLTSSSPIKKDMNASSSNTWDQDPYLYMKGAYSYVNCEKMLDDISGIYSTSLGTARSMTADDINNILGVTVASDKVYYTSDSTQTNIDLSVDGGWLGLGSTYTYTASDYTPESYLNGQTNATAGTTVTQDGYWYDYTAKMAETIGNTTLGELLFDGTTSDSSFSKSYWLASPGVGCYSFYAYFGPGGVHDGDVVAGDNLFDSYGIWGAGRLSVRPVVCLNSDITVDQLQVIDGEVETWTYDNSNPFVTSGGPDTGTAGANVSAES